MSMPLFASPEQLMREKSEIARKGIARGRSVVVLKYAGGVLFVAEIPAKSTLRKVSELYDRIGFAAAGRYSEFEGLRRGGIRHAELWGFAYDRRDVSARQLANVYAQSLGQIFTEQLKPYEVELCVAEVGASAEQDQMFRLTYDGSIVDESRYMVMGGNVDPIVTALKDTYSEGLELSAAVDVAVRALSKSNTPGNANSNGNGGGLLTSENLEVAVLDRARLDRARPRRAFRRIAGEALTALLPTDEPPAAAEEAPPATDK
ncbi:proteasome subunit alpha [Kibdelosporangium phytohabitans]|uniref:Proteasome subunit alpha n=1 Tax=Kibdelosporangium phytohabitans TaxID=860235 RepID=A0A0N9I3T7_9PSEU|nr:proteasome subunit alpha [Kibdelosporangium phytohabitans]ALG08962.1 proteasome subunit alpha [Kibdelosporangium phytohabitans]MBE1469866.1 proteasome alpha subunit [Kibdelosporangium phytohabitans]